MIITFLILSTVLDVALIGLIVFWLWRNYPYVLGISSQDTVRAAFRHLRGEVAKNEAYQAWQGKALFMDVPSMSDQGIRFVMRVADMYAGRLSENSYSTLCKGGLEIARAMSDEGTKGHEMITELLENPEMCFDGTSKGE